MTHDFGEPGGVATVVRTFYDALSRRASFRPEIVSLATSRGDPQSVSLRSPRTWFRGVTTADAERDGYHYRRVGSVFSEIEPCRYWPRRALTELLETFDLVQVIGGLAAWARPLLATTRPLAVQFATTAARERATRLREETGARGAWTRAMTRMVGPMEMKAIRNADLLLVENIEMRELCEAHASGRVLLLCPPVDSDRFRCRPDPLGGGDFILSVGRFSDPRKAPRTLFEAYARARSLVEGLPRLVLAGDPPTAEDMAHARSLGIADAIELKGRVSDDDLGELYRSCQAFVLASDQEGLGIVLLEAMASGAPVITTATEGGKVVVEPDMTGLLVPVGDASRLAEAIARVATEPELRASLANGGLERVRERFSVTGFAEELEAAYRALLPSSRRP
ncbi:MAG TPA: glycosyltransferase [Actinomycetota bacterium]